jgi:hypothetical protein
VAGAAAAAGVVVVNASVVSWIGSAGAAQSAGGAKSESLDDENEKSIFNHRVTTFEKQTILQQSLLSNPNTNEKRFAKSFVYYYHNKRSLLVVLYIISF